MVSIPVSGKRKNTKIITGWNENVRVHRNQSIFWHNLWKDYGRPIDGLVCEIRRRTRFNYHLAIKKTRRNENKIKRELVASKLKSGNSKYFWNEINRLNAKPILHSNIIDNKTGEEACELFKSKYEVLYNEDSDCNISSYLTRVHSDVMEKCQNHPHNDEYHLHEITASMVRRGINKLNIGGKDDSNNVFTDAFLEAPKKLDVHLAFLLSIMLRHGLSDLVFDLITFSPLVKNKRKDISNSDNYRAIALNNALCKILDYILIDYFRQVFQSSDYQFAYKSAFSTSLCSYLVMETVQYYVKRGSNVISTLLDCSKAFDKVRYGKLFNILIERGLCPLVTKLLIVMYSNIKAHVKWNNIY